MKGEGVLAFAIKGDNIAIKEVMDDIVPVTEEITYVSSLLVKNSFWPVLILPPSLTDKILSVCSGKPLSKRVIFSEQEISSGSGSLSGSVLYSRQGFAKPKNDLFIIV